MIYPNILFCLKQLIDHKKYFIFSYVHTPHVIGLANSLLQLQLLKQSSSKHLLYLHISTVYKLSWKPIHCIDFSTLTSMPSNPQFFYTVRNVRKVLIKSAILKIANRDRFDKKYNVFLHLKTYALYRKVTGMHIEVLWHLTRMKTVGIYFFFRKNC